jgi:hypothetical protein
MPIEVSAAWQSRSGLLRSFVFAGIMTPFVMFKTRTVWKRIAGSLVDFGDLRHFGSAF